MDIKLVVVFGVTLMQIGSADNSKFELYVRDQCTGAITCSRLYYFQEKVDKKIYRPESKTGVCILPHTGEFQLYLFGTPYPLTYKYGGQSADTLNIPALFYAFPGVDVKKFPKWKFCNTTANGKLVDYFKPNIKRLEGQFNKGKPVGKLVYYDLNGKIIKVKQVK
jgi:hypothetical protein